MTSPPPNAAPPPPDSTAAPTWTAPVPTGPDLRPVTTVPRLTWFRLHASSTVIDFPLHSTTAARAWVATMWPDTRIAGGWQRQAWQPGPAGRGFVPAVVELGDVLQFGIEHLPPLGARPAEPEVSLWHGYLHAVHADSILVHGPHPTPRQALAAAQHALVEQIHHTAHTTELRPTAARPGAQLGAQDSRAPITPAQPPTSLTVAFHDAQATVGDPAHGWLVVDTTQLTTALTRTTSDLTRILTGRVHLTGREPPITLAALAAQHAPEYLTTPNNPAGPTHAASAPSGPPAGPPDPATPPASTIPEASL